ncbi:acyltransferase [Microbacterium sp. zg.B48]|uniref:acyltransferase family protein n=1 Tax=unclassified Microbacterium TaxID=2609290 RepID=UPI00214AC783|nr:MULTISPECIES: acyltransferase [unclassified Microbacterium]MCR2765141.1 acyltransferase [Microbacterium sp. zg.B48]MCR2810258.1 acyltransferase [Microbacterium sp. zg.B185]WIM19913.1 acyltransferase [Microbacterium sp. zg-B185]
MDSAINLRDAAHAPRLDAITGLRWWAAFAVFGFHIVVFAPLAPAVNSFLAFGDYGVAFFFILSGFVLTYSLRPGTAKSTFYWRRFARIYPLHFVTLLLAIPVFYSFAPAPQDWWVRPFSVGALLLSVFLLQGWSRDPAILFSGNPAAWTLTVEAFFYALHPFFAAVLTRMGRRGALVSAAVVAVVTIAIRVLIQLSPAGWVATLPLPILRLNEFVLGMCLAWAFRLGWRAGVHPWLPAAGIGVVAIGYVLTERFAAGSLLLTVFAMLLPALMTLLFAALIVTTSAAEVAGRVRWMRWRPLVLLGEWSFAFYLIHATVIYAALNIFGLQPARWMNLLWFAALLIVAITCAAALHIWLERPVESKLRAAEVGRRMRRESRRQAKPPAPLAVTLPDEATR